MLSKATGWLAGLILSSTLALQAMAAPDPQAGQLLLTGAEDAAVHLDTAIALQIQGLEAEVVMTQRFQNQSDQWVDGVYVFPLAESSAVTSLHMRVGERVIIGEIQERQQARARFEVARASGQKATLVEQHRPNLFRQELANIAPGETVEIRLGYSQAVIYSGGQFRLSLPTTLTPRYIPGNPGSPESGPVHASPSGWALPTDQVTDAPWITPPQRPVGVDAILNPLTLTGVLKPGAVLAHIDSATHGLTVGQHAAETEYHFQLENGPVSMDRDVELSWTPVPDPEPVVLAFSEAWQNEVYLQLLLMPPPVLETQQRLSRELVLVVDTSGSMAGTSIVQARESALMALERLQPDDRFNVLLFDSSTRSIFDGAVPATDANLHRARSVLQSMQASGGTEMFPALSRALAHPPTGDHLQQIVFVTDGSVGNEAALLELIYNDLGNARLFMVSIGSAPNHFFMRRAAEFGRGSYTDIAQLAQVRDRMGELLKKLESPLVTDLQIHWPWNVDMYPERMPDLYWGQPLRVVARVIDVEHADQPLPRPLCIRAESKLSGHLVERRRVDQVGRQHDSCNGKAEVHRHAARQGTCIAAHQDVPLRVAGRQGDVEWLETGLGRGIQDQQVVLEFFVEQQVLLALAELDRRAGRGVGICVEVVDLLSVEAVGVDFLVQDARRDQEVVGDLPGERQPPAPARAAVDVLAARAALAKRIDEAGVLRHVADRPERGPAVRQGQVDHGVVERESNVPGERSGWR